MRKNLMRSACALMCSVLLVSGCAQKVEVPSDNTVDDAAVTMPVQSAPFHIADDQTPILDAVDISSVLGDVVADNYLRLTGVQVLSARNSAYPDELVVPLNGVLDNYIVGIPVWVDGSMVDVIIWKLWNGGVKVAVSDYYNAAYTSYVGDFPQYFVSDIQEDSVTLTSSQGGTVQWFPVEYYDDARGEFTDMISMTNPFGISGLRNIQIDDCYYKLASDIGVSAVYAPLIDGSVSNFISDPYTLPAAFEDYDTALCIPVDELVTTTQKVQVLSMSDYTLPSISGSLPVLTPSEEATASIEAALGMSAYNPDSWRRAAVLSLDAAETEDTYIEDYPAMRFISGR